MWPPSEEMRGRHQGAEAGLTYEGRQEHRMDSVGAHLMRLVGRHAHHGVAAFPKGAHALQRPREVHVLQVQQVAVHRLARLIAALAVEHARAVVVGDLLVALAAVEVEAARRVREVVVVDDARQHSNDLDPRRHAS